jgi:hypothetical protein
MHPTPPFSPAPGGLKLGACRHPFSLLIICVAFSQALPMPLPALPPFFLAPELQNTFGLARPFVFFQDAGAFGNGSRRQFANEQHAEFRAEEGQRVQDTQGDH